MTPLTRNARSRASRCRSQSPQASTQEALGRTAASDGCGGVNAKNKSSAPGRGRVSEAAWRRGIAEAMPSVCRREGVCPLFLRADRRGGTGRAKALLFFVVYPERAFKVDLAFGDFGVLTVNFFPYLVDYILGIVSAREAFELGGIFFRHTHEFCSKHSSRKFKAVSCRFSSPCGVVQKRLSRVKISPSVLRVRTFGFRSLLSQPSFEWVFWQIGERIGR